MNNNNSSTWREGLSGPKLEIAETNNSPLRVLAGPGTGKTFALMRRVARLLEEGIEPERILVCTFTRVAASDLKSELSKLGVRGVDNVHTGTIHSFCFRLLTTKRVFEQTQRVARPLLDFEKKFLLEDLKGHGHGIGESKSYILGFEAAWANLQTDEPGWPHDQEEKQFDSDLKEWLKFHDSVIIGEVVPEALKYLRNNPASSALNAYDHVLVDEYQDLNRAEQDLLDLLSNNGSLTIIGDEKQSIYSFKYANPEGIADFEITHPTTHDVILDECRRCPRLVVDIANYFIGNNDLTHVNLIVHPDNPEGTISVTQWQNRQEEAKGLASAIKGSIESGKVLVLAPNKIIGYGIRDCLEQAGVKAHSFFSEEPLDGNPKQEAKNSVQKSYVLLSLLANNEDVVSLRCWCGFDSPSLNSGAWKKLWDHCKTSGDSPWTALEKLSTDTISISGTKILATRFRQLKEQLNDLRKLNGISLFNALFTNDRMWLDAVQLKLENLGDNYSAKELYEILSANITQPELPTDVDYVRVMSLHKSKRLTADFVIVVGCVEGLVPYIDKKLNDSEKSKKEQEGRRLFYVAITRTRKYLILSNFLELPRSETYKMNIKLHDGNRSIGHTSASRFIHELGPSCPRAIRGNSLTNVS